MFWVAAVLLIGLAVHCAVATRWRAAARSLAHTDGAAHADGAAAEAVGLAAVSTVLQWVAALLCLGAGGFGFAELEVAVSLAATGMGATALRLTVLHPHEAPTSK